MLCLAWPSATLAALLGHGGCCPAPVAAGAGSPLPAAAAGSRLRAGGARYEGSAAARLRRHQRRVALPRDPGAGLPPLYRGAAGLRGPLFLAPSRGQPGCHGTRGLAVAALRAGRLWGLDPHHAGGPPHRALPQERARQAAPDGAGAATGVALRQAHPAHRLPQPGALWRQPGGGAGGEFRLSGQERGQADPRRGGAAGGAAPGPQPLPAGQAPRACPRRPRQGDAAAGGAGRLARGGVAGGAYRACAGPRSLHAYGGAAVCPAGGWQPAGGPGAHHHRRGSAALAGGPGGELYPPLPRADLGRLAPGGQQHNGGARLRG
ncbi:hypothetical protein D3C73_732180 [compost metagenome]